MNCRHCKNELKHTFLDLGSSPPSNSYLSVKTLIEPEKWYPLKVLVCDKCWLVQTEDFVGFDEMFSEEYAYFSSFSTSWLEHSEKYVADMIARFGMDASSLLVEVAANDGYLLQFAQKQSIPCLGIEPTHSTAEAAREKGLEIIESFFGEMLAKELVAQGRSASLTAANNVLAHVPDINDFVKGFSILLREDGVSTFEFPHLLNLVNDIQFDTIYHEHFSYLSLTAVNAVFATNGLTVFDVEELSTHGGSLRVYAQRTDTGKRTITKAVRDLLAKEENAGMRSIAYYEGMEPRVRKVKSDLLQFLIAAKQKGKRIAAYGAAAKGNTMMNYAGIRSDLVDFVVDRNPAKQNRYMPGSRIPIVSEEKLKTEKPDYVCILPWNLKDEIIGQLDYIRAWNGKFVIAIPSLTIID